MASLTQECSFCGKRTKFMCIKEVTLTLGNCRRTIHYWLKGGKIHGVKTAAGRNLICEASLFSVKTSSLMVAKE